MYIGMYWEIDTGRNTNRDIGTQTGIHLCKYVCIYIYIHMNINKYIHIYTHMCRHALSKWPLALHARFYVLVGCFTELPARGAKLWVGL